MKNNKTLKIIGIITLLIVISNYSDGAWAGITLNSTNGTDTLKLLKILPSSGETVNVSGTIFNNSDSTVSGIKSTENVEIKKASSRVKLNADSGTAGIDFYDTNVIAGYLIYQPAGTLFQFLDSATAAIFTINATTGDITKMGKFTQNVEIGNAQPRLQFGETDATDYHLEILQSGEDLFIRQTNASTGSVGSNIIQIDGATGDITKVGGITVGNSSNAAKGTLKSNNTGLYVYNGTAWSLIKAY